MLLPLVTLAPIAPIWWVGQTEALGWLAAWVALAAFFSTATGPLIDSAVLELVAGTPHTFGSIRVWGTFGFILASPTMGALLRPGQLAPIFIGYAVCMAAAGLAAVGLPARRQAWLELIGCILFALPYLVVALPYAWQFFMTSYWQNESSTAPNGLPARYIIKGFLFFGFLSVLLAVISVAARRFVFLFGSPELSDVAMPAAKTKT